MKPFQFGFILGRFNHIHIGHERMINFGLDVCEELLVLVGSSQEKGTERNPFDVYDRIDLIRQVYGDRVKVGYISDYTNENDICFEWGAHVLKTVDQWAKVYGIKGKPDVTIFGNDEERALWYDPADIQYLAQLVIPRANINISATELRQALVYNQEGNWKANVNAAILDKFGYLRKQLMEIPFYQDMIFERAVDVNE
jgi:bifunctional NMN adenylyltransferase/nudix hydrolase